MVVFGLLGTLFDWLTFVVLLQVFHADADLFRTGWFVGSTLTELAVLFVLRTRRLFFRSTPGRALFISSIAVRTPDRGYLLHALRHRRIGVDATASGADPSAPRHRRHLHRAAELDLNPVVVTADGIALVDVKLRLAPIDVEVDPFLRALSQPRPP